MKLLFPDFSDARRSAHATRRACVQALRRTGPTVPGGGTPRRILLPVLDSVSALPAARYVAREYGRSGRLEVHLLHVRTPLSLYVARWIPGPERAAFHRQAAERVLRPVCGLLNAVHVRHVVHIELGDKAPVAVSMARRLAVDRIVCGLARENSLLRLYEDPVIERVIDYAPVPVDVVGSGEVSRSERIAIPVGIGAALGLLCARVVD